MKTKNLLLTAFLITPVASALAHHGGVSAAFGPGAPVETSSPLTLPKGKFLLYERVEISPFKKFGDSRDDGGNDKSTFTNTLLGYGINDAVSAFVSLPYAKKELIDDNTSQGFGDINLIVQYGFKHGSRDGFSGWYSFDADDTAGKEYTLPEWKYGLSFSTTLPSGEIHNKDKNGDVLGLGSQTGFAVPSYNFTGIASKMFAPHWTWSGDIQFRTFAFNGGSGGGKPGNEFRINNAVMYEAIERKGAPLSRLDLILEANFLDLRKDLDENRVQDDAAGGSLLYLAPGIRFTFNDKVSMGLLYKEVVWKDLNNEDQQQGGEGLEEYRFIATLSSVF
ncbi:MAG: hypothetical protein IT488_04195 [Gammaproteobacteria bacterium]|nr:hypothetical protein [Gammaproteobacteria bacterium]